LLKHLFGRIFFFRNRVRLYIITNWYFSIFYKKTILSLQFQNFKIIKTVQNSNVIFKL